MTICYRFMIFTNGYALWWNEMIQFLWLNLKIIVILEWHPTRRNVFIHAVMSLSTIQFKLFCTRIFTLSVGFCHRVLLLIERVSLKWGRKPCLDPIEFSLEHFTYPFLMLFNILHFGKHVGTSESKTVSLLIVEQVRTLEA